MFTLTETSCVSRLALLDFFSCAPRQIPPSPVFHRVLSCCHKYVQACTFYYFVKIDVAAASWPERRFGFVSSVRQCDEIND